MYYTNMSPQINRLSGEHSSASTNMAQHSKLLKHLMQDDVHLQGIKLKLNATQGMSHAMTQGTDSSKHKQNVHMYSNVHVDVSI